MKISVDIAGARAVKDALSKLPKDVEKRVITASIKHAAEPVVAAAKRNARRTSSTIANAITTQIRTYKSTRILKIGPSHGDRSAWRMLRAEHPITGEISMRFHKPEFTAHLVEGGTKRHRIRLPHLNITIVHPGTEARPYLAPALRSNDQIAIKRFQEDALKRIEKRARRLARKAEREAKARLK